MAPRPMHAWDSHDVNEARGLNWIVVCGSASPVRPLHQPALLVTIRLGIGNSIFSFSLGGSRPADPPEMVIQRGGSDLGTRDGLLPQGNPSGKAGVFAPTFLDGFRGSRRPSRPPKIDDLWLLSFGTIRRKTISRLPDKSDRVRTWRLSGSYG